MSASVNKVIRARSNSRQALMKETARVLKRLSTACLDIDTSKEEQIDSIEGVEDGTKPQINASRKVNPETFLFRLINSV